MYRLVTLEDIVRVPPSEFGEPLKEVVEDILKKGYTYDGKRIGGYEGLLDKDLGTILAVTEIKDIKGGSIIPGDGAAYYTTIFQALTFKIDLHEIVDGEIVDIVEFGAFMRFGPLDGLIHVSQIADDYIVYDEKRAALVGKESNRALEVGDKVRARIVAVSLNPKKTKESKINLTMRQPNLGKFEWLEEEKKKEKKILKEKKEEIKEVKAGKVEKGEKVEKGKSGKAKESKKEAIESKKEGKKE